MTELTVQVESLRQVDRVRSTTVGRTYELTLVKDYVSRWGLAQAVREVIQNALDSGSPFQYEFKAEEDTWTLRLNSQFSTLEPSTLLLGYTSKRGEEDCIGSFGEGYKLALLVLTRLGVDVEVLNGDVVWRPRFRFNRIYNTELLVIDESFALEKGNQGLTFFIHGLSMEDKQAIVDSCLYMQDNVGAIKSTTYGDILLERPSKLYVGYLYICDTELNYGYNIKPRHIKLERDRQTVDGWDLKDVTSRMWLEIGEPKKVAEMIAKEVPDVYHAAWDAPEIVKEECYKIFRKRYPTALIAASADEARKKIGDALVETVYVGGGMYYAVSGSPSYASEPRTSKVSPTPKEILQAYLNNYQDKHMSELAVKAFHELIREAAKWRSE